MTAEISNKMGFGRPAPEYTHRRNTRDWMRANAAKLAYRGGKTSKLRVRSHNRSHQAFELTADGHGDQYFTENFEATFKQLASQWQEETKAISAIEEMAMHPTYQRIIGIGPAVIPHIMRALEQRPDNWFWALRAITGADPVQPEQRGRMSEMAKAWIAWAHANHIDW